MSGFREALRWAQGALDLRRQAQRRQRAGASAASKAHLIVCFRNSVEAMYRVCVHPGGRPTGAPDADARFIVDMVATWVTPHNAAAEYYEIAAATDACEALLASPEEKLRNLLEYQRRVDALHGRIFAST